MASGIDRFRAREERRKESAAKRNIPFTAVEPPKIMEKPVDEIVETPAAIVQESGKSRILQFSC